MTIHTKICLPDFSVIDLLESITKALLVHGSRLVVVTNDILDYVLLICEGRERSIELRRSNFLLKFASLMW